MAKSSPISHKSLFHLTLDCSEVKTYSGKKGNCPESASHGQFAAVIGSAAQRDARRDARRDTQFLGELIKGDRQIQHQDYSRNSCKYETEGVEGQT